MPKVNKKLTETAIRNAKPIDKKSYLFDDGGLRLLIRPTGTKVWQYPYRLGGKNNIYTIGKYGQEAGLVNTAEARKIRDEIKDLIKQGLDPNKNKRSKKTGSINKSKGYF